MLVGTKRRVSGDKENGASLVRAENFYNGHYMGG